MKKQTLKNIAVAAAVAMTAGIASADVISPGTALNPGNILGHPGPLPAAKLFRNANATKFVNNPGGIGHYLVIPYYTAQNSQSTAFHITNTDLVNGKAVKVRFRGAGNSDDVMDFQIYLSPGDYIGFGIDNSGPGNSLRVSSTDNSCTIPYLFSASGQGLMMKAPEETGFFDSVTMQGASRLPSGAEIAGALEGYIEIFTMADMVDPDNLTNAGTRPRTPDSAKAFRASKHINGVASCDPAVFNSNSSILYQNAAMVPSADKVEILADEYGFDTPTTGLMGNWYIINGIQNTAFSGPAIAIEARDRNDRDARGNFVIFPQRNNAYNETDAKINERTTDPLFRRGGGVVGATKDAVGVVGGAGTVSSVPIAEFDLPDMSTPYLSGFSAGSTAAENQVQMIGRSLATDAVINQFVTNTTFETDWVFSMPTRRYSVALDYATTTGIRFSSGILGVGGRAFFHDRNVSRNNSVPGVVGPRACVATTDRVVTGLNEEQATSSLSPALSNSITFCGETTVLAFNIGVNETVSGVLDSSLSMQRINIAPFTLLDGWLSVDTSNDGNSGAATGIPVVGYAAIRAVNDSFAPRRQFGYTWPHKTVAP